MLKIGLTGGMGSGKSTVARIFELLGIPVFYADSEAKKLMTEDPALREGILGVFGSKAYPGGQLDRKFIADQVFTDPEKLSRLNALVHPATILHGDQWMNRQSSPYALKEAALIFEGGVNAYLDLVIGVSAPEELRIRRSMERDGFTRQEVLRRMAQQMPEDQKMKLCDFIIVNDEQHAVIPQVLQLHQKLLKLVGNHPTP